MKYKTKGELVIKYIKSPLNYVGGKYKLLPQIIPLFPKEISTFVDLFAGGCNVGINISANKIICNDIETHLIDLLNYFKSKTATKLIGEIEIVIDKYNLSQSSIYGYEYYGCDSSKGLGKYNKENYIKLRADFNNDTSNSLLFYVVVLFAFNNQIRFNSKGEFNMPVNKRDFNNNVRKNLIKFINRLEEIHIEFTNKDFRDYNTYHFNTDDFVYCDPPYLVTTAAYNENDGWTEQDELDLLSFLDNLHNKNIKFALSNVLESKGKSNDILKEWSNKYNIHFLDKNYSNSNYQRKNTSKKDIEVLITNY